jgi:hypothetical protein
MIRTKLKWCLGVALGIGMLVAASPEAKAINAIGGFGGRPQTANNGTVDNEVCFTESWGTVVGSGATGCSNKTWWEISVPTNSSGGTWTPSLYVNGSLISPITCGIDSSTNDGVTVYTTTQQTESSGAGHLSFSLTVPANGFFFAACGLTSGSQWYSVSY